MCWSKFRFQTALGNFCVFIGSILVYDFVVNLKTAKKVEINLKIIQYKVICGLS